MLGDGDGVGSAGRQTELAAGASLLPGPPGGVVLGPGEAGRQTPGGRPPLDAAAGLSEGRHRSAVQQTLAADTHTKWQPLLTA